MIKKNDTIFPRFNFKWANGKLTITIAFAHELPEQTTDMIKMFEGLYKDQKEEQSFTASVSAGFSPKEIFLPDAEFLPNYVLKGFSEKFDISLWDGFHKVMINMFEKMN